MSETKKFTEYLRRTTGFALFNYMSGIDIGYGGEGRETFLEYVGYDKDSANFDPSGKMPYSSEAFDAVYSSHCLEHISDYKLSIGEWHRILKFGGLMVLLLPHQFLYEKKENLPSLYNHDHKRFYTPASLLKEIEESLRPNTYRVRELYDLDVDYDYEIPPFQHPKGNYSIVCILEKIRQPYWELETTVETLVGNGKINGGN